MCLGFRSPPERPPACREDGSRLDRLRQIRKTEQGAVAALDARDGVADVERRCSLEPGRRKALAQTRLLEELLEQEAELLRARRVEEQARSVGHDLARPAEARCNDGAPERHRLDDDEPKRLRARRRVEHDVGGSHEIGHVAPITEQADAGTEARFAHEGGKALVVGRFGVGCAAGKNEAKSRAKGGARSCERLEGEPLALPRSQMAGEEHEEVTACDAELGANGGRRTTKRCGERLAVDPVVDDGRALRRDAGAGCHGSCPAAHGEHGVEATLQPASDAASCNREGASQMREAGNADEARSREPVVESDPRRVVEVHQIDPRGADPSRPSPNRLDEALHAPGCRLWARKRTLTRSDLVPDVDIDTPGPDFSSGRALLVEHDARLEAAPIEPTHEIGQRPVRSPGGSVLVRLDQQDAAWTVGLRRLDAPRGTGRRAARVHAQGNAGDSETRGEVGLPRIPRRRPGVSLIDVLFVHYGDPCLRGSENCLLALLERLDRGCFRSHVVCNQPAMRDAVVARGVGATQVGLAEIMIDRGAVRVDLAAYLRTARRILALARERRAALLYCNSGRAAQASWLASRWLGIPRLCHIHAPFYRRYYWLWGLWDVPQLVFPSEATRRVSLAKHRPRRAALVVPNGADLERFRPAVARDPRVRVHLGIGDTEIVIGQIGSLISRKGADVLLRAFAALRTSRPVRLLLVGSGPERERLERLASELGVLASVRFLGEVRSPETLLQHAIDVNVLAAHDEAMPLALIEASACGLPSVCTDVGGNREVIVDGETGLLVPASDAGALAFALGQVIGDPALRARLGASARRRAEKHFGVDGFVASLERAMLALVPGAAAETPRGASEPAASSSGAAPPTAGP